jgi:predicted PurR-regulated permease PerM
LEGKAIRNHYKLISVLIILLALSFFLLNGHYAFSQTDPTELKLQAANTAVGQAFNAVLDAEKAGANVTDLIAQLNDTAGILAQAQNMYRIGDSNTAATQADNVLPRAQAITGMAQDAKQSALESAQSAFWSTMTFTLIGGFVFVLALFLVWRWFKRSYINSLNKSKPELTN